MTAPHTPARFLDRHLGTTGADLDTVLTSIGARSLEDLAVRVVPATLPVLDLPQQPERPDAVVGGLSENEAVGALRSLAALNDPHTEMIGRGYHPTITPAIIVRDVLSNPAWTTAYTPYQAEISQGRLEAQLLFQTVVADLTGLHPLKVREAASIELIRAVVALRNIKSEEEIAELDRAAAIGYEMHTTAMRMAVQPGMTEAAIAGALEGIASSRGSMVSFPSIVSMHGEVLHGFPSTATLDPTRLLLVDAGAESREHYCSDHTRTTPISGRFTQRQRDVYDIVVDCHDLALKVARPGVKYMDVHLAVCRLMTERLQALGLMKGDVDASVAAGAHALFLPHGLGHAMGMDVHDMEALGQVNVGYDDETRPSDQFGLASLRFGRRLEVGHVVTDEPGIYFIPDLIDLWRAEGTNSDFLNFDAIESYKDFGGIRIEDDLLITADGCRFLGTELVPYHSDDVEAFLAR